MFPIMCLILDTSISHDFFAVDFRVRRIEVGGKRIKLQIWELDGRDRSKVPVLPFIFYRHKSYTNHRYQPAVEGYYRRIMGFLIVYDITNQRSFNEIQRWIKKIHEHAGENVEMMILGTKCDGNDQRKVIGFVQILHHFI